MFSSAFNLVASLLLKESLSFSKITYSRFKLSYSSFSFSNSSLFLVIPSSMASNSFCCVLNSFTVLRYDSALFKRTALLYWSYTFSICFAAFILSEMLSRLVLSVSIFSIASDIGRRSSSDNVCKDLLKISLITEGLKSLESFGVRSCINKSSISLYSSIVSKPNINELTQLAYSFCESITLPPSPIRFLNSVLEYAILFCTSL